MYRVKPSKPVAVFSAIVGVAMLVFGLVSFGGKNPAFMVLWCAVLVGIVGMNLWAAFSRNGSTETITTSDGAAPRLPGSTVTPTAKS